ncbi:BlaI/MecI/CopY family transcriptional regulator [candidate division KSB1 bacterium]|nr:BlaI/MecI/CopY family transcriptional regulator [candidate division KSB1 bacterium]
MDREKLTPVEWEIMEAVWQLGDAPSVREVLEHAFANGEKAYTTIQTMMNILVKKGYLDVSKKGLVNFYKPVISRPDVVKAELTQMVSKVFRGSIPAMASCLINMNDLSRDEIGLIKKYLNEKEAQVKGEEQ